MRRFLKILAGLIGTLLLLVVVGLGTVWAFPGVLNSILVTAAERVLPSLGVQIPESTLDIRVERKDWTHFRIGLSLDDADVRFPRGQVSGASIHTRLTWSPLEPTTFDWNRIEGNIDGFSYSVDTSPSEEPQTESTTSFQIPIPDQGQVGIRRVEFSYPPYRFEGSLHAEFLGNDKARAGISGTLPSEGEKGQLAATYEGNLLELDGYLSALLVYQGNRIFAQGNPGDWRISGTGAWGKADLHGDGLEQFSGTVTLSDEPIRLRNCSVSSEVSRCTLLWRERPVHAVELGVEVNMGEPIRVVLTPHRLPPWVLQHGDRYEVTVATGPLKVSMDGLSPPLVVQLQGLIDALPPGTLVVPRPLNALQGTLTLSSEQGVLYTEEGIRASALLRSELQSQDQAFRARIEADFTQSPGRLMVRAVPERIQLVAPPIRVLRSARFVPEERYAPKEPPPKKRDTGSMSLEWTLDADDGYPLAVLLPERQELLEAQALLTGDGKTIEGWVALKPTSIGLMGNIMRIRRFRASPLPNGEWSLNGRISAELQGYQIFVDLGGTSAQTQLSLSSSPPLPEREIVNLFLFGRLSTGLSSTERDTSGNFQAAAVDGAFNLFSLFFLSQSPIRSLSYNPISGRVGVSLDVGEGSALTLETETGRNNSLEWQKRLGGNWWFTTRMYSEEGVTPSQGQTFLEWIKQY